MNRHLLSSLSLFSLLILSLLLPSKASGQFFWQQKELLGNGPTDFQTVHPPLVAMRSHTNVTPFIRLLYIYGDGNFVMDTIQTNQDLRSYQFGFDGIPTSAPPAKNARLYSVGGYSGGQEPPQKLQTGGIPSPNTSPAQVSPFTAKVAANRYLHLQRNADAKPGDTLVYVISFKNISPSTFSGSIVFFYNGKLRQVNTNGQVTQLSDFAKLGHNESLLYKWISPSYGSYQKFLSVPFGNLFNNASTYELANVPPNAEVHLFAELTVDPGMESLLQDTAKIQMDLMAVALADGNNQAPSVLSNRETETLNGNGLNTLMGSFSEGNFLVEGRSYTLATDTTFSMGTDFGGNVSSGMRAVDSYTSTMELVRSHDPNYLQAFSCACAENTAKKKVVFKVHCENEGFGHTSNIYIDMKLPAGIRAGDIIPAPFWVHPGNDPNSVNLVEISDDSIRWEMPNFLLFSKLEFDESDFSGQADSSTFAEITFFAYVDDPASIDSLQACVRFDDISRDPVCTAPTKIALVSSGGSDLLVCGACPEVDTICTWPQFCAWPWWLWLIAILLLLLLLWLWRRRSA